MSIEFYWPVIPGAFPWPSSPGAWLLLLGYGGVVVVVAAARLRAAWPLARQRWRVWQLAGYWLVALLFSAYPLFRFPALPFADAGLASAPILALVPVFLVAAGFGPLPALLIGATAGLVRSVGAHESLTVIFEYALTGYLLARLLSSRWPERWLRRPLLRTGVMALAMAAPLSLMRGLHGLLEPAIAEAAGGLLNYALLEAVGVTAVVATATAVLVLVRFWHADAQQAGPPGAAQRAPLQAMLMSGLLVASGFGLVVLAYAQYATVLNGVVESTLAQAQLAAKTSKPFLVTGRELITTTADSMHLLNENGASPEELNRQLQLELGKTHFFHRLWYFTWSDTGDLTLVAATGAMPSAVAEWAGYSAFEDVARARQEAIGSGQFYREAYVRLPESDTVQLLWLSAGNTPDKRLGLLVGATPLAQNVYLEPIAGVLDVRPGNPDPGFLLDDSGAYMLYPARPDLLTTTWAPAPAEPLWYPFASETAGAFLLDGEGIIRNEQPMSSNWQLVTQVPLAEVRRAAARAVVPHVLVAGSIVLVVLLLINLVVARVVTQPLRQLVEATEALSRGQFEQQLRPGGSHEVNQLGLAFEDMRRQLSARYDELQRLLHVTRLSAAHLNVADIAPEIVAAARQVSGASSVRLLSRGADAIDQPAGPAFAAGDQATGYAPLDLEMWAAARRIASASERHEPALRVANVRRARTVFNFNRLASAPGALLVLPMVYDQAFQGVLWLAWDKPQTFADAQTSFLSTLAGIAASAVANDLLYQASEGGRQRLAAILENTPDSVLVVDQAHRLTLINRAAEQQFGLNARQHLHLPLSEVLHLPALTTLLHTSLGIATHDEIDLGDARSFRVSVSPVHTGDGRDLGHVVVLRDVSHYRQIDQLKTEFVNTVSHDLRAPLNLIRGYASILPMMGKLNPKQQEFVDNIVGGLDRLSTMVEDLLDLERLNETGGLIRRPIDMPALIDDVLREHEPQAFARNIKLSHELPSDLPAALGDGELLRRVFANLLDNGIQFTPAGGSVVVQASANATELIISVRDSGIGIAPADQDRVFEKFYRVRDNGATDRQHNKGLGLSIAQSILQQHDGRIWLDSRLGEGSTFHVALPLASQLQFG